MPYKSIKALSNLIVPRSQSGLKAEWGVRALLLPLQLCVGLGGPLGGSARQITMGPGAAMALLPFLPQQGRSPLRGVEQRDAGPGGTALPCASPRPQLPWGWGRCTAPTQALFPEQEHVGLAGAAPFPVPSSPLHCCRAVCALPPPSLLRMCQMLLMHWQSS